MALQTAPNAKTPPYSFKRKGFAAFLLATEYQSQNELEDLNGCQQGVENLKALLPSFSFEVAVYKEKATISTLTKFEKEWEKHDFSAYDAFFLYVLAHGNEKGLFIPRDNNNNSDNVDSKNSDEFLYIRMEMCLRQNLTLAGKPKWIIFDCCQGKGKMNAVLDFTIAAAGDDNTSSTIIQPKTSTALGHIAWKPQACDFLITSASVPGYVAYAQNNGTVLSNALYEILSAVENNRRVSINYIVTEINRIVSSADVIQMSTQNSRMTRKLYLTRSSQAQVACDYKFEEYKYVIIDENSFLKAIKKLEIGEDQRVKLLEDFELSKTMCLK